MREPKLNDLKIDPKGTRRVQQKMAGTRWIKITINIDKESLDALRTKADETGIPYQRLLNRYLKKALESDAETESRLNRLEADVAKLKKKIVA